MILAGIVIGAAAAALVFFLFCRGKAETKNPDQPWLGRSGVPGTPEVRKDPLLEKTPEVKRRRWNALTG